MEFYDVGTSDLRELWESYLSEPCSASEVQVQSWTQVGGAAIENMKTCRPDVASSVHQGLGQDVLMATREEEWGNVLCLRDKSSLEVVLRDRLMTDAALGGPRPIKSEHSYSLLTSSPPPSPATPGANPHTPNSGSSAGMVGASTINDNSGIDPASLDHHKSLDVRGRIDDMEEDCFLAIPMNAAETPRIDPLSSSSLPHASSSPSSSSSSSSSASSTPPSSLPSSSLPSMSPTPTSTSTLRLLSSSNSTSTIFLKRHSSRLVPEDGIECPLIKDEPISAPSSPIASRQSSCETMDDKSAITMISPRSLHFSRSDLPHTSDSEEDDEEYYQGMEIEEYGDVQCASNEPSLHSSRQSSLPPTPPSSASSDSEGTASASCSPERRDSQHSAHVQNLRGLLTPRLYVTNAVHATRQPIHTPLISCQPKGSTGVLTLTEEEKRTLIAEGYPVPTKLPLTKQEEKSLKKVRRKIKNKISAQESRRKKKEYMDGLERRVTMLSNENSSYRNRLNALEDTNRELLKELQRLQTLLQMQSS